MNSFLIPLIAATNSISLLILLKLREDVNILKHKSFK